MKIKATETFSEWQERAAVPERAPVWLGEIMTRANIADVLWHFHQWAPASARDLRSSLQLTKLIPRKEGGAQ